MAVDIGFDESGDRNTLLLSAQVGVVGKVRKMGTAWKTRLFRDNVDYFHAVEYDRSSGVFGHLDRRARKELLHCLGSHLRKKMLFGITVKIDPHSYKLRTDNKFRSQWATAYPLAMQAIMLITAIALEKQKLGNEVNIVLESGHANVNQALDILLRMKQVQDSGKRELPLRILSAEIGCKVDYPILQAADMLAYSEWQSLNQTRGDIYDELHAKGSRYLVCFMDMDKTGITDEALTIAKRSDEAKPIVKLIDWYGKKGIQRGKQIDDLTERIREFRQKYAEVDGCAAQSNQGETGGGKG
jgi:hypothetical protein